MYLRKIIVHFPKAIEAIEKYTLYKPSLAIFAPEAERGAIPSNKIPVYATEDRLAKFALSDRIFWIGGVVDSAYVFEGAQQLTLQDSNLTVKMSEQQLYT